MFIKFIEDFKSDEVIASKVNPFENETIMHSFHVVGGNDNVEGECCYIVPNYLPPIDVLYKSKQTDEQLYIVLTNNELIYGSAGSLTINLNGSSNIILKSEYSTPLDESEKIYQQYKLAEKFDNKYPIHYYFPISKKNFLKCCQASTMAIQVKKDENTVLKKYEPGSWNEQLLPIFRMFYNKTIDNNMFVEAEKEAIALYQLCDTYERANEKARKKWDEKCEREDKRYNIKLVLFIVATLLAFILAIVLPLALT